MDATASMFPPVAMNRVASSVSPPGQLPGHQVHVLAEQLAGAPQVLLRGGEHVQQPDGAEVVGVGQGDPAVLDEGDLHRSAAEVDDEGALPVQGDLLPTARAISRASSSR